VCLAFVNGGQQSNWDEVVDNFDDMELKEELLRGIYAYGFEKPSAIQQRAIIPCIKGKWLQSGLRHFHPRIEMFPLHPRPCQHF